MSVIVSSGSRSGGTAFYQGMPITISIFLSNNIIHRANEEAIEKWQNQEWGAKSSDSAYRDIQNGNYITTNMLIKLADNGDELLSKLNFKMLLADQSSEKTLNGLPWIDMIIVRSFEDGQKVILGKMPVWVTFEIPPDITRGMMPGRYKLIASYPDAEPGAFSISISPALTEVETAILHYEQAEYYLRNVKDFKKAVELALLAEGKLTEEPDMIYLTLGDAYLGMGELEKAVNAYERFLKTYEGSPGWNYPSMVRETVNNLKKKNSAKLEEQQ